MPPKATSRLYKHNMHLNIPNTGHIRAQSFVLFFQINGPKPKNIKFLHQEKQQILRLNYPHLSNCCTFAKNWKITVKNFDQQILGY